MAASDRMLATGGASPIEGGGGGGIVPWAVIAGYGTDEQWGGSAFLTRLDTGDYRLDARGVAVGWRNRLELSLAKQSLALPTLADTLVLPVDEFRQDIFGLKLRLAGDLIYTDMPQISLGLQHKRQRDFAVPAAIGARECSGTDVYLAASKLFLAGVGGRNLLLNLGLRSTRANQGGLLGFGGDQRGRRSLLAEGSMVLQLNRRWALGYEYRQQPDNLSLARESDWQDAFLAWFPNKRMAWVAAYADLGSVAGLPRQRGWYLSMQLSM